MLDALRRGTQTWVAKILFGILIVSFGVFFGIEDVFRGFGRGSLAKVGDTDISATDFQNAFQSEVQTISRNAGRRISTEEARAAGLDALVLRRLINDAAISTHARDLKLAVSDKSLIDNLHQDENLQGPDGKFSSAILEDIMRQMGVNERGLLSLLRKDELKRQILTALSNSTAVPQPMLAIQHAWSGETRKIEHFTIDAEKAVTVPDPDDAALMATYESNKGQFAIPEYRKIAALILSVDDLKKEMTVSDEEIKKAYEQTKETYDIPEKRRVQQIAFKDKAAAQEAKKALDGGKSFRDAAKDAGATENDINLGLVTQKQLIDKTVAEAAFKLKRDEISPVIDALFKPVIVRVVEIQDGKESKLAEVSDKIKEKLAKEKAAPEIQSRYELVEESRNLGKSLKEISETLKLRYAEAEATDRTNKKPDGSRALDHPDEQTIVSSAFSSEQGIDRDAVELKQSNGYAWVDVLSVTPQKDKPFEDAKAAVKTLHIDNERKRLVDELASKLVARSDTGDDFAKLAVEGKGTVQTTDAITRTTTPPGLSEGAVQKAFSLAKGKAGAANTSDGKSRAVFKVNEIIPAPAPTEEQKTTLADQLRGQLAESELDVYVQTLSTRQGVEINEAELKRATGAGQQ